MGCCQPARRGRVRVRCCVVVVPGHAVACVYHGWPRLLDRSVLAVHPWGVVYRILGDAVMLIHFGFLVFLAVGGFLACRFRWVIVLHLAAACWALMSVLVGAECPLTGWEDELRRLGGGQGLPGGFIDTYLTGVVYPDEHLRAVQLFLACLVVLSWLVFALYHRHAVAAGPPGTGSGRGRSTRRGGSTR
jgi:hypothetical protein